MATTQQYVDSITEFFASGGEDAADLLFQMATNDQDREKLYALLLLLLVRLRTYYNEWSNTAIPASLSKSRRKAQDALEELEAEVQGSTDSTLLMQLQSIQEDFRTTMGKYLASMAGLALLLLRGDVPAYIKEDGRVSRDKIKQQSVQVMGRDAKQYRYPLSDITELAANVAIRSAESAATAILAEASDYDLVQVSPNPSTIGDYCDAYRGKVFSLSGKHSTFPHIRSLPGGSCPIHPRCHHTLNIYSGGPHTGQLDPAFAALAASGVTDPNAFQALWKGR